MFEADIMLQRSLPHTQEPAPNLPRPVMAHPPTIPDDAMPFTEWLEHIIDHYKSLQRGWNTSTEKTDERVFGIKLDFKDPDAVEPCLIHLKTRASEEQLFEEGDKIDHSCLQVWLNADVLQGPGGRPPSFSAPTFVTQCLQYFPDARLSIGWTTGNPSHTLTRRLNNQHSQQLNSGGLGIDYDQDMVNEMLRVCKEAKLAGDQWTFPVMAAWVMPSWENLSRLLAELPGSSLTLWGWCDDTLLPWLASQHPNYYDQNIFVDCKVQDNEESHTPKQKNNLWCILLNFFFNKQKWAFFTTLLAWKL